MHVPSIEVVNAQRLAQPGARVLLDGNGRPSLLAIVFLALNAGDGYVSDDEKYYGLTTALCEGHLHIFQAILCAGPGEQWARVGATLNRSGSGVTVACRGGTTRSITYRLTSTFRDAPAAQALAALVGAGKHLTSFTPAHANAIR